jgi:protein-tyrosine-phosphatase
MTNFDRYTDSILSAFERNPHSQDVINKKHEIIASVYEFYNSVPDSVLFVGYNPAILASTVKNISVTELSEEARTALTKSGIKFKYVEYADLHKLTKQFDVVVALDEYFTFAQSDEEQQHQIKLFCNLAREFVISTLKDYKNQDYKDREYSQPVLLRSGSNKTTYIESHDWDIKDRAVWKTSVYEIDQTTNQLQTYGPVNRRTMYFKQLAKFSLDAGAENFLVHKNLMYKSLVKRNYEHVISITFDGLQ